MQTDRFFSMGEVIAPDEQRYRLSFIASGSVAVIEGPVSEQQRDEALEADSRLPIVFREPAGNVEAARKVMSAWLREQEWMPAQSPSLLPSHRYVVGLKDGSSRSIDVFNTSDWNTNNVLAPCFYAEYRSEFESLSTCGQPTPREAVFAMLRIWMGIPRSGVSVMTLIPAIGVGDS